MRDLGRFAAAFGLVLLAAVVGGSVILARSTNFRAEPTDTGYGAIVSGPVPSTCRSSSVKSVFSYEAGYSVLDSGGTLFATTDDGHTWARSTSLPRPRVDPADQACGSTCFRIRSDRLGIEELIGEDWATVWEYPPDRYEFLARQLPGDCGEGYGQLGIAGLVPGSPGSRWVILAAGGNDGLMGMDVNGTWVQGILGNPAVESPPVSRVYLIGELLCIAFFVVGGIAIFLVHDGGRTSLNIWISGALLSLSAVVLAIEPPWNSLALTAVAALGPVLVVGSVSRRLYLDAQDVVVALLLAGSVFIQVLGVRRAKETSAYALILSGFALVIMLAALTAVYHYGQRPQGWMRRWAAASSIITTAGAAAIVIYGFWITGAIARKSAADILVILLLVISLSIAALSWKASRLK